MADWRTKTPNLSNSWRRQENYSQLCTLIEGLKITNSQLDLLYYKSPMHYSPHPLAPGLVRNTEDHINVYRTYRGTFRRYEVTVRTVLSGCSPGFGPQLRKVWRFRMISLFGPLPQFAPKAPGCLLLAFAFGCCCCSRSLLFNNYI